MYCGALNEKEVQNKGDLPRWLRVVKNPPANAGDAGDTGLITGLGRSPGEGNGNPLQYSCLENPIDRGAWQATVHRVATEHIWLIHFPVQQKLTQHCKATILQEKLIKNKKQK